MSGKGAHVQDISVLERRLRPIYDWLDSYNYKKALQECDKVLKKNPNFGRAKGLKALALLRMGRESECTAILDALKSTKPSDDAILQAMSLCYKELQQLDKICELYEIAIKVDPTNEELHTQLFMSYVSVSNFKQQQQAAMVLYKLAPKNPYYCWAVMSIVLQATRDGGINDPKKHLLLLSLAERMMEKLIQENKLEAEQEVQLYMMVLKEQGKFDEMIQLLDGPLGTKLTGETIHIKLECFTDLKRWKDVNMYSRKLLSESVDRWDIWKYYLNSVLKLTKLNSAHNQEHSINNLNASDDINELFDDSPDNAYEFICELIEAGSEKRFALRGPYLARFELYKLLCDYDSSRVSAVNLMGTDLDELFIEYFRRFGYKSCCVSDLRSYLHLLDDENRLDLAGKLVKDVGISAISIPQSEEQMQRHICSLQLSRLCGSHLQLSAEHITALVVAFSLHYQHGRQAYGGELLETDQAPADAYALLATHLLYDLHVRTFAADKSSIDGVVNNISGAQRQYKSARLLKCALALLRHVLSNSPSNFHAKLLALRIYHILGCLSLVPGESIEKFSFILCQNLRSIMNGCRHSQNITEKNCSIVPAQAMYESLDIKHLQLDSMSFVHCEHLITSGHFFLTSSIYETTLKFFSGTYKDSSYHLTFSYKYGSFLKLSEFMEFRERMNKSLHYVSVAIDTMYLNIIQMNALEQLYTIEVYPTEEPILWDQIRSNSDWNVYVSWDPDRRQGPIETWPEVTRLRIHQLATLRLRAALLECTRAALALIKETPYSSTRLSNAAENGTTGETLRTGAKVGLLTERLNEWKRLWDEFKGYIKTGKEDYKPYEQRLICMPAPSRLHQLLECPYYAVLRPYFDAVISLANENYEQFRKDVHDRIKPVLDSILETCSRLLNCSNSFGEDDPIGTKETFHYVCNIIEILSISNLLCVICAELTKTAQTGKKKRKNDTSAPQQHPQQSHSKETLSNLVNLSKTTVEQLQKIFDNWSEVFDVNNSTKKMHSIGGDESIVASSDDILDDLTEKLSALNLNTFNIEADQLNKSYSIAAKEIKLVLKIKLKLLNSIS